MHKFAEKIAECVKAKIEAVGIDNIDCEGVKELGEWIDIAKDLTEYDKNMRTIKAMDEAKEDDEAEMRMMKMMQECEPEEMDFRGRMGYDRYRYANGRFAPKGRGRRMGYPLHMMPMPYWDDDDYMAEYMEHGSDFMDSPNMRPGYSGGRGGNSGRGNYGGNRGGNSNNSDGRSGYGDGGYGYSRGGESEGSRYGRSYDNYRSNRRHYTETQDPEAQRKMKDSIGEVFDDMEMITVDIVKDLTPEEKQKYKQKLATMMQKIQ